MGGLSHLDGKGRPRMVDVSAKDVTAREAVAAGEVRMRPETIRLIREGGVKKGEVLSVAQVAAVMGAKRTPELIPMCHPLAITGVDVDFTISDEPPLIEIRVAVKTCDRTGVEMEALTAVAVAALTIYDMVKSADREVVINNIRLLEKRGGKSGEFRREQGA